MIKLFVDTNVFLDTLDHGRTSDWHYSQDILDLSGYRDLFHICISMKSIADISYVGGRMSGKEQIKTVLRVILHECKVLPFEDIMLYEGLKMNCPDLEDAMQISCAGYGCCDYIITRDKKHYDNYSDIPVYSPKEFIEKLQFTSKGAREDPF